MSQLSTTQVAQTAAVWANAAFVVPNVTAHASIGNIQTAVSAIDTAFDTTLSAAVASVGGAITIANALSAQITASLPQATAQQQTLLVCYVLMKRAGII